MIGIFFNIFTRKATTTVLSRVKLKYGDSKWTKFKENFYRRFQNKEMLRRNTWQNVENENKY
jgi:hypothetical protein